VGTEGLRRGDRQPKEVGLRRPPGHFSFLRSSLRRLDSCILTVRFVSFWGAFVFLGFSSATDVVIVRYLRLSLLVNLYCFFSLFMVPLADRVGVGHASYPFLRLPCALSLFHYYLIDRLFDPPHARTILVCRITGVIVSTPGTIRSSGLDQAFGNVSWSKSGTVGI